VCEGEFGGRIVGLRVDGGAGSGNEWVLLGGSSVEEGENEKG
jgi:hypothetical protein